MITTFITLNVHDQFLMPLHGIHVMSASEKGAREFIKHFVTYLGGCWDVVLCPNCGYISAAAAVQ